jgi:threonine/homoserine/homoserine lactone efflux protein
MIEMSVLLGFIAASAALIAVPGPNIAVIMATGAEHGARAAMTVVLATTLAQVLQIALVVLGLAALLSLWSWAFIALKWIGVAYLVWLGISTIRKATAPVAAAKPTNGQLALRGAMTALANPKTLAFHAAFLPLFIDQAKAAGPQLALLGAVFIAVALIIDSAYALASGGLRRLASRGDVRAWVKRVSGSVMLFAAGWLALRKTA